MRSLISALAAAGLVMATLSGYAAEESTVKSKPDPNKPGRTVEKEQAVRAAAPTEQPVPTAEKK